MVKTRPPVLVYSTANNCLPLAVADILCVVVHYMEIFRIPNLVVFIDYPHLRFDQEETLSNVMRNFLYFRRSYHGYEALFGD